jgi:hypothetical protein
MLTAQLVSTEKEIEQIAALSAANLSANISAETKAKEGFVSWIYDPATLQTLHAFAPSVIVKDRDVLAGYAITLTPASLEAYPAAIPTYNHASALIYKGRSIGERRFYLMGQICIAEPYRGKGLVDVLYQGHRRFYSHQYDCIVTEISTANPRSLKAHRKVGFEIIDTHLDPEGQWDVVVWDWSK